MKTYAQAVRVMSLAVLVAVLSLSLAACKTPAGRTSGQVVDDATITSKVKAKLLNDSVMGGVAVSVETFEGNVTLTGAVPTDVQKKRAGQLAKTVDGVQKVNNLVLVRSDAATSSGAGGTGK